MIKQNRTHYQVLLPMLVKVKLILCIIRKLYVATRNGSALGICRCYVIMVLQKRRTPRNVKVLVVYDIGTVSLDQCQLAVRRYDILRCARMESHS